MTLIGRDKSRPYNILRLLDRYRLHDITDADVAYHVHAGDGVTENRIVGWKTRLVFQADEELAAVRVGASIRHRDGTGLVWALDRLIVEFIAGAARPRG